MIKYAPLPVGKDDYEDLMTSTAYAIDKSLLIEEIINSEFKINLITRPRRFGKTLALSMLKYFFERPLNDKDYKHLFNNTKIAATPYFSKYQGKYPVIFITLKGVRESSWQEMRKSLVHLISEECAHHSYLLKSEKLTNEQKQDLQALISRQADDTLLRNSLKLLSSCLETYHNEKVIILIDEYDTPLTYAFVQTENDKIEAEKEREEFKNKYITIKNENYNDELTATSLSELRKKEEKSAEKNAIKAKFYDDIRDFIRFWFSDALKSNTSLKFAVLTGITRLVNESIFSELNNVRVSTVFDKEYADFFGFTKDEMERIYQDFKLTEDEQLGMTEWYDGYLINNKHIYNPWSVINALASECDYKPFWTNTSSNPIVPVLFSGTNLNNRNTILAGIQALINYEDFEVDIKAHTGFQNLYKDADNFFCYLTNAGYLTIKERIAPQTCTLKIPNKEIFYVFPDAIQDQLNKDYEADLSAVKAFRKSLVEGNVNLLSESINGFIYPTVSFYDTHEDFYHGVMLGLTFSLAETYYIYSNRESGYGRFDLMLCPKENNKNSIGVIIECKKYDPDEPFKDDVKTKVIREVLKEEAKKGLEQINNKDYAVELRNRKIETVHKYTVIFYKKLAEVLMQ